MRRRITLMLGWLLCTLLFAASPASAVLLGLDTASGNNLSEFRVRVEVSGPASSVAPFDQRLHPTSGSLDAESFGILVDAVRIRDVNITFEGIHRESTIGVSNIPISLDVDPIDLLLSATSPAIVNPVPGSKSLGARTININLTGSVTIEGTVLPFAFYVDPIDCLLVACYSPSGGPFASTAAFWADSLDMIDLAGRTGSNQRTAGFSLPSGGTRELGTVGGLVVKVSASAAILDAQFGPMVVPEPSTALLMGLGLVGLGAADKRK